MVFAVNVLRERTYAKEENNHLSRRPGKISPSIVASLSFFVRTAKRVLYIGDDVFNLLVQIRFSSKEMKFGIFHIAVARVQQMKR